MINSAEKFIAKRKGELFKRVKPSTLVKLLQVIFFYSKKIKTRNVNVFYKKYIMNFKLD